MLSNVLVIGNDKGGRREVHSHGQPGRPTGGCRVENTGRGPRLPG